MKNVLVTLALPIFLTIGLSITSCGMTSPHSDSMDRMYPIHQDNDDDGVNDFMQPSSHFSLAERTSDHDFVDDNNDGICDMAQNASNSWHGPGYTDSNDNGICDLWDNSMDHHNKNVAMRFDDANKNGINDPFEKETHAGDGHEFIDEDGDGVCDIGQTGKITSWHGSNFVDRDGDHKMDHWQMGGMGHE